jgi:hypothetical protein
MQGKTDIQNVRFENIWRSTAAEIKSCSSSEYA